MQLPRPVMLGNINVSSFLTNLEDVDEQELIRLAREKVNAFLSQNGVKPRYENTAPIQFIRQEKWGGACAMYGVKTPVFGGPGKVEGFTTPPQTGAQEQSCHIFINKSFFTFGSVVHEIFHSLECFEMSRPLGIGTHELEEGVTEYFTCKLLGAPVRPDRAWDRLYEGYLRPIQHMVLIGIVTEEELLRAYFLDDTVALEKIAELFEVLRT